MSIHSSELRFLRARISSDIPANGGRMGTGQIADSIKNALFPDVTQVERTAGLTRWRKLFVKLENANQLMLSRVQVCMPLPASGDARVTLCAGTQRDTQADLASGHGREYGAAVFAGNVNAGATSFSVLLKHQDQDIFKTGDLIRVGDALAGEYFSGSAVTKDGPLVTFQLAPGDALSNDWPAETSGVGSVLVANDLAPALSGWTETSIEGVYDESAYPLELDNLASVEDDWTIVFDSATGFNCSGTISGQLSPGNVGADYAPINPQFNRPYFTLRAAGWSGTWASGNTVTFTSSPAALPLWLKMLVPPGAAAIDACAWRLLVRGEA